MRLYTRTGATALDDPEFGHFDADETGGFDLPQVLADRLHGFHIDKQPLWETGVERQHRLVNEELERRKDPATLLDAVNKLVQAAQATAAPIEPPATPAQESPAPTPAEATSAAEAKAEAPAPPATTEAPPAPTKRAAKKAATTPPTA